MTVLVDTLAAKKKLVSAGFTDKKAEGIVEVFADADEHVATKDDIELLRRDLTIKIMLATVTLLAAIKFL